MLNNSPNVTQLINSANRTESVRILSPRSCPPGHIVSESQEEVTWAGVLALVKMFNHVVHSLGESLNDKLHEAQGIGCFAHRGAPGT